MVQEGDHEDQNKSEKHNGEFSETHYITCVVCPLGCNLTVSLINGQIVNLKGNNCKRGYNYALAEITNPVRVLTTTVKIKGASFPLMPVKSDIPIPKKMLFDCMKVINCVELSVPAKLGDIIIKNILNTGANIVATRTLYSSECEE